MLTSETFILYVTDSLCLCQMTQHNVGALVVVKSGENKSIAGIITERGKHLSYTAQLTMMLYLSVMPI